MYDFMSSCPGCGKPNRNYKKATYKCKKCGVPVSSKDPVVNPVTGELELPDISKCWNGDCGETKAEKTE